MICVPCFRGLEKDTSKCNHCGDCRHTCQGKCPILTRIAKMKAVEKERPRVYYATTPVKKEEKKVPGKLMCEKKGCPELFTPEHPLQRFCSTPCGRSVRNANYRAKCSGQGQPPSASAATP